MPRRVRKANQSDVDASCAVLADAFSDYEWTRWTVDAADHRRRIESLQRLVLERIVLPYGEAWIAEDDDGLVASVALWMLPDSLIPPAVAEEVAAAQAELEGTRHAASMFAESEAATLRPAAPHFYLGAVGTRSERRGSGSRARRSHRCSSGRRPRGGARTWRHRRRATFASTPRSASR